MRRSYEYFYYGVCVEQYFCYGVCEQSFAFIFMYIASIFMCIASIFIICVYCLPV
jgi:hypothetical protein